MPYMLIVDDEPDICECLSDFFSAKGFSVHCAFSGEDALHHLIERPPDVLLLDLRLPDIWGMDVLRRAKRLSPTTKVVVVSSLDHQEPKAEAKACGASGYVTKPFDFSEVTWASVLAELH